MEGPANNVTTQLAEQSRRSYGQILKSSVLVGGSSAANIVIGVARAKAMALLLGPPGVGLMGLYNSIFDVTSTIAGLGVNSSGVRQIAAAVGTDESELIARTTVVLRRVSILLGLAGAVLLIAFSGQISTLTFGSRKYGGAICLLSVAVFFRLVSAGQNALIQGMRRIAELAKMGIWSACLGTAATVIAVFFMRENGIVLSLVCGAAITLLVSWLYSRHIRVAPSPIVVSEIVHVVAGLLKLGVAFMATVLITMASTYIIRVMILRQVGLEGAGLYQAAWALGALYVGFILQAMGADFYPRLTATAHDHAVCNRMVNEQAYIGLLLGGPGVLATLTIAPFVISIFYTAKFHAAVGILRWLCLGTILQVISWPMGFIVLAKGRQNIFVLSDLAWSIVYISLAWVCIRSFGLNGVGIAFFGSYIFHGLMTYPIVRRLTGFNWSNENKQTALLLLLAVAGVFCGFHLLPFAWATTIGLMLFVVSSAYSIRVLVGLVPLDRLPGPIRLILLQFRSTFSPLAQVD